MSFKPNGNPSTNGSDSQNHGWGPSAALAAGVDFSAADYVANKQLHVAQIIGTTSTQHTPPRPNVEVPEHTGLTVDGTQLDSPVPGSPMSDSQLLSGPVEPMAPPVTPATAQPLTSVSVPDPALPSAAAGSQGLEEVVSDPQFLQILSIILQQLPTKEMQDPVRVGMARHWLAPPVQHIRLMLGDETLSLLDCRRFIFYPTSDDMRLRYPRLVLSPPSGLEISDQHPQRKIQAPALTLLYFVHQHSWELVRPFIIGGGLQGLASLAVDTNLFIRAQAVEILHRISNGYAEAFDWWQKPNPDDAPVHRKLFDLLQTSFLANLLANIKATNGFPNGSYLCLQLVAFWLSYVRHFWTKDNVLRVSQETLDTLKAQSLKADRPPEERELATKLLEDFGRWPALDNMVDNGMRDTEIPSAACSVPSPSAANSSVGAATASTATASGVPTPDLLKEQGNAVFKAGSWDAALALYTAAIDLARSQSNTEWSTGPRMAVYHNNRAAAYAKLWEQTSRSMEDRIQYAKKCLADCDAAIAAEPSYLKAHYRKASVLLDMGLAVDREYLLPAARAVTEAVDLANEDEAVNDLADRIQVALRMGAQG